MRKELSTVLDRMLGQDFDIRVLLAAVRNSHPDPLAQLILDSEKIFERSQRPWEFKSVAHFGEEDFIASANVFWIDDQKNWRKFAAAELSERISRLAWFERDEGLQFWVETPAGKWRPARKGDESYDYVSRLREEYSLSSLRVDRAPRWAEELFISQANWQAYKLIWGDGFYLSTSHPDYSRQKSMKVDAVLRETQRLMGETAVQIEPQDAEPCAATLGEDKPLHTKERTTLLTIIGLIAESASLDITAPSKIGTLLEDLAVRKGISLSERSIREHLKSVNAAMSSRRK